MDVEAPSLEAIREARRQLGDLWAELGRASRAERTDVSIGGRGWTPTQISQYLSERDTVDSWIPDRVPPTTPWPLSDTEIEELFALLDRLTPDRIVQSTSDLPALTALPNPSEFEHMVRERTRLAAVLAEAPQAWQQWAAQGPSSREELAQRLDDLRDLCARAIEDLLAFQASWAHAIRSQMSRDPGRRLRRGGDPVRYLAAAQSRPGI